ncbi:hypothetical protein [Hoeflea sp.]|uniref:hypothetical protein n=1 Tax=Hoeflea sp. TaxID=1940281 RepID=UPI0019968D2C|nr:hypothetical protein [Hoeflea sp.]MBC7281968.1 hypothetical protein [Hoeflea sp.]
MKVHFFAVILFFMIIAPVFADTQMWVAVDIANRRTCPSTDCGVVGKLFFRESAKVAETVNGWARVSRYYDAACSGGRSAYVEAGRMDCTSQNGINDGQFAEWIRLDMLAQSRPADPGAGATGTAKLVAQSDDFHRYLSEFVTAAETLLVSGRCSAKDFASVGGFIKSTSKGPGVYFTYCGGGSDQVYLDVTTGKIR